jgi:hypothetical protein
MIKEKNRNLIKNYDEQIDVIDEYFIKKRELLLSIYTRCDIALRRLMREILYVLQKEKFSKKRKTFLL